ncbi:MAG TPA: DUF1264 domain-containing protein [Nitrososphaeraceae archaeon]|nr:DUF1264 domain-containing protein [Nitrososphaeraceae archaeon]
MFFKNQLAKNKKKEMLLRTTFVAILPFVIFSVILATATMTTVAPVTTSAQQQNATSGGKPVDGYNLPQGHITAIRHVFDDPSLRVHHYCKMSDKIFLVCQLYDSESQNATLIGMEYIITHEQYNSLPDREKPNWHYHKIEFAPNRADPKFPELNAQQTESEMMKAMDTYGKVIITWNPNDNLPAFPAQEQQVEHPFMVNATVKPETTSGSFNQTLKY